MSRKAILVGAAPFRTRAARARLKSALREKGVLRVAVDGGYEILRSLGVKPDLYVGDLDSVRRIHGEIPAVFLPHEKSYSDLRAALEICSELGIEHVEAWAVTGGRADHHWASIEELGAQVRSRRGVSRLEAHGEDAAFLWVTPAAPLKLKIRPGTVVSVFDLGGAAGVTTKGLAFNLKAGRLESGSHGLSNFARSKSVTVALKKGVALVVVPART